MPNYLNPHKASTWVMPSGIQASAQFAVVGEQPNISDFRAGKPFSGPVGSVLNECLVAAQIARGECYNTYVIKDLDRPQWNYYSVKNSQFTGPGQEYITALKTELENCQAKVIIAVGELALNALTSRKGINKWRGSILDSTLVPGKFVVPILDPKTILPPSYVYVNSYLIIHDLKKAQRVANTEDYQTPEYNITIKPTFAQCQSFLNACEAQPMHATDIEVHNLEVSCISFAYDNNAISIPFMDNNGDYFTPNQELEL